mmetsp:Transcript_26730/g.82073  ORF Transcript_26730/g.82073 Transcript_26730/m.82073 type:complete len:312 (+) Transcript_26730:1295-2230(+)
MMMMMMMIRRLLCRNVVSSKKTHLLLRKRMIVVVAAGEDQGVREAGGRSDEAAEVGGGCFGRADLGVVVDVDEAEARGEAVGPLEVVEDGPGEVGGDVDAVEHGGGRDVGDVVSVVAAALGVGEVDLERRRGVAPAVFGDDEGAIGVPLVVEVQERADAAAVVVEPAVARRSADGRAVREVVAADVAARVAGERGHVRAPRRRRQLAHEARGVGVEEEVFFVVRALDEVELARGPVPVVESWGRGVKHGVGPLAVEDGIEEERTLELEASRRRGLVTRGIERDAVVRVQSHAAAAPGAPGAAPRSEGVGVR